MVGLERFPGSVAAALALALALPLAAAEPQRLELDGDAWRIVELPAGAWESRRFLNGLGSEPTDPRSWMPEATVPARVPGSVVADLLRADVLADPHRGLASRSAEWVTTRDWLYSRRFEVPASWRGRRVRLVVEGIDPGGVVFLDGEELGRIDEIYVTSAWEVGDRLAAGAGHHLDVLVHAAPADGGATGNLAFEPGWRPRFATGWDFAPRLPSSGLWGSVRLEAVETRLDGLDLRPEVSSADVGTVRVSVGIDGPLPTGGALEASIRPAGETAPTGAASTRLGRDAARAELTVALPDVRRWWPNGEGEPALYEVEVRLVGGDGGTLDRRTSTIGFRTVAWRRAEGAPDDALPYAAVVNGRPLFLKGWNWVPADQLYGRPAAQRVERLLRLARDSGANLIRVWGGGLVESETFYRLADRLGLMVWQDLPRSSRGGRDSELPSDPSSLARLERRLRAVVEPRRDHPSLVLWCGGNELVEDRNDRLRPLGFDHPELAAMRRLLAELDPDAAVLPTTPSGGAYFARPEERGRIHDGHGPWNYLGPREHAEFHLAIDPALHSEFGVGAAASLDQLRVLAPLDELWPADWRHVLWRHHGRIWWNAGDLRRWFGRIPSLRSWVAASRHLQAEGLRYAIEADRRRFPRTVGAIAWMLDEPWPNAISPSVVEHSGAIKPGYWAARRAFAARSISADYRRTSWRPGELWSSAFWVVQERGPLAGARWSARLLDAHGRPLARADGTVQELAGGLGAHRLGELEWPIPPTSAEATLLLRVELTDAAGHVLAEHESVHAVASAEPLRPLLAAPPTRLCIREHVAGRLDVANCGSAVAIDATIEVPGGEVDDGWRHLLPGERWSVTVSPGTSGIVRLGAWNAPVLEIRSP